VDSSISLSPQQQDLAYSLFVPHHYEPNYAYPLLIWLHGPGDGERQMSRVIPHISTQNYLGISPRGSWSDGIEEASEFGQQVETEIESAERQIFACIDIATARYHVDAAHVFLAGYQAGGTMALRIGLRNPTEFAGSLSLGGPFPTGYAPLAQLRAARRLPLFISQGRDSESYPAQRTCDELRLFHAAAMHVTLRQYPCGDELTTQMLSDMNTWMMEQVTGVSESATHGVHALPNEWN
jgi:phospholipase/carboxylesterase